MRKRIIRNNIILKIPETIEVTPNRQIKPIKPLLHSFGIIDERRNPKVITDEHKLFGTKPNHKYY